MDAKDLLELTTLRCPNCDSKDFMFSGLQNGYGYVPDMELWTCMTCYSTLSKNSLSLKGGAVQNTRR